MRTTTKTLIAAVSVVALLGVGVAAAETPSTTTDQTGAGSASPAGHESRLHKLLARFHFAQKHPWAAIDKVCDGNITVSECKDLLKQKVQDAKGKVQQAAQARYEKCLESRSQDYCDGRLDQFKADHPRVYGNQTAGPAAA
jgi:hypothetical protein